jgi:hypothetical protein
MSELYRLRFDGEPLPGHPLYWEAGETAFYVMLFADDMETAEARARELARIAYYEPKSVAEFGLVPKPYADKKFPDWAHLVLNNGIACHALHLVTGAE